MAKKLIPEKKEKISKKEFRKEVMQKLAEALADYKQQLGEKKFESRVRKASKLFSRDMGKINKKNKLKETEPVSGESEKQEAL